MTEPRLVTVAATTERHAPEEFTRLFDILPAPDDWRPGVCDGVKGVLIGAVFHHVEDLPANGL